MAYGVESAAEAQSRLEAMEAREEAHQHAYAVLGDLAHDIADIHEDMVAALEAVQETLTSGGWGANPSWVLTGRLVRAALAKARGGA